MTLPELPAKNEDPWFDKRNAFDLAVKAEIEGRLAEDALSAAIAGATRAVPEAQRASALASRAQADLIRSASRSRVAYEDAASFVEAWGDFTKWSSGTAVQASGGKVYGNGGGGASGITHAFPVADVMRVVVQVTQVAGGSSGGVIVGVSSGTAGAAPAAGGADARGMYFLANGEVRTFDKGATSGALATATGTTEWTVTVTVDEERINVSAYSPTAGEVYSAFQRTAFTINNLFVFNSDSRQLTGNAVGKLGARAGTVTVTPRAGIEGVQRTVHRTVVNSDKFRIALPPAYDSRVPMPAVILFHGNGSDESTWTTNANMKAVADAFLNAGFICLSVTDANTSTWGAQASLDAYAAGYQYLRDRYAVGGVIIYANSMGGIESLLTLAENRIPGVVAWIGTVPTFDLANNYANPLFTAVIKTAYGIASDGSDYAAKTAGHDPALIDPIRFRSLPMWALVATDDTSVNAAANGLKLASRMAEVTDIALVQVTGGHSTTEIATRAPEMVAFAKNALGVA